MIYVFRRQLCFAPIMRQSARVKLPGLSVMKETDTSPAAAASGQKTLAVRGRGRKNRRQQQKERRKDAQLLRILSVTPESCASVHQQVSTIICDYHKWLFDFLMISHTHQRMKPQIVFARKALQSKQTSEYTRNLLSDQYAVFIQKPVLLTVINFHVPFFAYTLSR